MLQTVANFAGIVGAIAGIIGALAGIGSFTVVIAIEHRSKEMKDEVWGNIYDLGLFLIPEQIEKMEKKGIDVTALKKHYLYQYEPTATEDKVYDQNAQEAYKTISQAIE